MHGTIGLMCGRYATTMDPETLYGTFDAEPDPVAPPGSGMYGGDVPRPRPGARDLSGDAPDSDAGGPRDGDPTADGRHDAAGTVTADDIGRAARDTAPHRPTQTRSAAPDDGAAFRPRYNIAPTDPVAIVRERPETPERPAGRFVGEARWGLVPSWAKDLSVGSRMFNARAESVQDKSAFRKAFATRRALLPASGYYEWQRVGTDARGKPVKQAYYITPADGSVMAFAGLWEFWRSPDGEPVVSTTIITTAAPPGLQQIHDRMPLVLPASEWDGWLDPAIPGDDLRALLAPTVPELVQALELRPVGPAVGNVRNDSAELIRRVEPIGQDGMVP